MRRPPGAIRGYRWPVRFTPQLPKYRLGQPLGRSLGVEQPLARPMSLKPLGHHEVLLEVILEWEVDEGPPQRRKLQRGGPSALDDSYIASGEVLIQARHVAAHLNP